MMSNFSTGPNCILPMTWKAHCWGDLRSRSSSGSMSLTLVGSAFETVTSDVATSRLVTSSAGRDSTHGSHRRHKAASLIWNRDPTSKFSGWVWISGFLNTEVYLCMCLSVTFCLFISSSPLFMNLYTSNYYSIYLYQSLHPSSYPTS